ncbi:MAG: CvpA family protein [Candidatus Omnitrophica bacterium]|nr:CvpA family protein [Candidatus Omnitrophota bacterium]
MGYVGFKSGMSAELVKLVALIAGFFVSFKYYQGMGDALAGASGLPTEWAAALTMAVTVIVLYFVVTRLLRLSEKLVQVTFAKQINSAGGLAAGVLRGLLTASVLLTALLQVPAPYLQASILEHSMSGQGVSRAAPVVYDALAGLPARLLSGTEEGNSG